MNLNDNQLVFNIKKEINTEECLIELVNRHSGIFYDMINRYVPSTSEVCSRDDLFADREIHIYNTALKFDQEKGAKFSTFLGNETKYLCLNSYNKAKKKYCQNKTNEEMDFLDKLENCDNIDLNLLNEIFFLIDRHPDSRVSKIFKMRYKDGENHKLLPWRDIAPVVNLSIQGCINIHDNTIQDLKRKLLKKELL